MTNKSEKNRLLLNEFLSNLKEIVKEEKDSMTINEIENYLNNKRYGLIWEEHEEKTDLKIQDSIPVFDEDISKRLINDIKKPINFLLEGDNLHSLYLLEKNNKSKVDVIYIDPPYNTGNKDFSYDDTYLDKDDVFKHSKWLSFMEKRLRLSKELLTTDGLIFVSIDENEQANLELLMNEIFGERNKIGEFIWKGRTGKGGTASKIAFQHEYIKVYAKNIDVVNFYQITSISQKEKYENLKQWGDNSPYRSDRPTMFFPILFKNDEYSLPSDDEILLIYDKKNDSFDDIYLNQLTKKYQDIGYSVILPLREDSEDGYGRWRQGVTGFKSLIYNKWITHIEDNESNITLRKVIPPGKESSIAIDSIIDKLGTSSEGTKEIKRKFGKKVFDTTKPLELIKYLIFLGTYNKPHAIVLDYFAGSGTTGEAVVELNKLDNGFRTFILANNNEGNIAEEVTYERLKMFSEGYTAQNSYNEVLFEIKLTPSRLKNMPKYLEEIETLKNSHKESYQKFKVDIKNQTLYLYGQKSKNEKVNGEEINLKYYKTTFIDKISTKHKLLTNELLMYIKEMVELDYKIDIDSEKKVKLFFEEEELDKFFEGSFEENMIVLIPNYILLKGSQKVLCDMHNISIIRIPEYYFYNEIRESGEL